MGIIASQPAFIAQYAPPKKGKTTDCLFSFPRAKWVAAPGALKPSVGVCGYEPPDADQHNVDSVKQATALVVGMDPSKYDALVVDDLTLLVDRTVAELTKRGVSGYDLWAAVHQQLLDLREAARRAGVHVILNAHESPPHTDSGTVYPGSLALPGKTLPYKIPAACDIVLHAEPAETGTVAFGWPVIYRCNPADATWLTGDRHNVVPDPSPMNLGEILRLVGEVAKNQKFGPRRHPALPWQEEVVERAATRLMPLLADEASVKAILGATFKHATEKWKADERHAFWTVRDTFDRAVLRKGLSLHRAKYYPF